MNERIRELVAQFGPVATISNWGKVEWLDNVYPQPGDVMYADVDLQKFAELIVKECIDVISPYAVRMENFDGGHPISDLKEHFGVEE